MSIVSFLNKAALNYIIFIITLTFIISLFFQQVSLAQVNSPCVCSNEEHNYQRTFTSLSDEECPAVQAICEQMGGVKKSEEGCNERCTSRYENAKGEETNARESCLNNCQSTSLEERRELLQDINRIEAQFRGDRDRYERECQQERHALSRINLPPGCKGRERNCRTEAEKCHDVQQRLGVASTLTPALQSTLGSDCPQLAKAKYDDDKERLDQVKADQDEAQGGIQDLQDEIQSNSNEYQMDIAKSQTDIQDINLGIKEAITNFESKENEISEKISESLVKVKVDSLEINRQIREKSRELNELQTDNNEAADRAIIGYRDKVRKIFEECNTKAKDAVEDLRNRFGGQAKSGTVTRLSDATQEGRTEQLRQTAIRAYAKCRKSQEIENKLTEAIEIYELGQRNRIREEGKLIDEITTLREQLENLSVASKDIVTAGDRVFQTLHAQRVDMMKGLNAKLNLENLNRKKLLERFVQQQGITTERLNREDLRLQKLSGEMLALEQSVTVGRPNSFFANLSNNDFQRLDEYTNQLDIAQGVCCGSNVPRSIQEDSGICGRNGRNLLQRRGRLSRGTN